MKRTRKMLAGKQRNDEADEKNVKGVRNTARKRKSSRCVNQVRKGQLLNDNKKEDIMIATLEKNLKLRTSSSLPKSFIEDGLNDLIEACDKVMQSRKRMKRDAESPLDEKLKNQQSSPSVSKRKRKKYSSSKKETEWKIGENVEKDAMKCDVANSESVSVGDRGGCQLENITEETVMLDNPDVNLAQGEVDSNKQLISLKREVKGVMNRLAEANMHKIAMQLEELYMSNSRNSINKILVDVVMTSLVSTVRTPERLVMETAVLLSVLHSNVGISVGANILHAAAKEFNMLHRGKNEDEFKKMDNLISLIAFLFNFKVVGDTVMYDILDLLAERFNEKDVELILLLLRISGISLRKNNSFRMTELLFKLQKKATSVKEEENGSRAVFMLDILLAIKNNNFEKIPNYDPDHMEHLKKLMKGFIHPGNAVTPINMTLEDILAGKEQGILRCLASGQLPEEKSKQSSEKCDEFSAGPIADLAKKNRMNTGVRKSIFTILVSSEDYLDAFEKIAQFHSKNQQDHEVMNLIVHCCLREKIHNPYYQLLACKLCNYNRKFLVSLQYSLWDKLDVLEKLKKAQVSNLAKFVSHCIIQQELPLSSLKVMDFSTMSPKMTEFLKEVMLDILMDTSSETFEMILKKVTSSSLSVFRESLWLYIKHILFSSGSDVHSGMMDQLVQRVEMMGSIFGLS